MNKRCRTGLPILTALLLPCMSSPAATITVDQTGARGVRTLRDAIGMARDGDAVVVMDGVYRGPYNKNLLVTRSISVSGQNGPGRCIVDCEGSGRVFLVDNPGGGNIVKGLTMRNGSVTGPGGALWCRAGKLAVSDCVVRDCGARAGGGIAGSGARMTISSCTVHDNEAEIGGGVCCSGGSLTMQQSVVKRNRSTEFSGGGLLVERATATLKECTFSGNAAADSCGGGGICGDRSDIRAECCSILENSAGWGGGVCVDSKSFRATGTRFTGNLALDTDGLSGEGGGIHASGGAAVELTNCLLLRNWADTGGAAVNTYMEAAGNVWIVNCTLRDNRTRWWDAIGGYEAIGCIKTGDGPADLRVVNSILFGLFDPPPGRDVPRAPRLISATAWGDLRVWLCCCDVEGGDRHISVHVPPGRPDIEAALDYEDTNIEDDPLFADDYHLAPDSPCVDGGWNAYARSPDIDGQPRIRGAYVDIGADEVW